jgi:hypothetical protein
MALIVVDEVQYIIDQMRTKGEVEIVSGAPVGSVPCEVVYDCDECLKASDLSDGLHSWYNKSPFYYYGNRNEVRNLLALKDKKITGRAKYPCIILEQPFTEVLEYGRTNTTLRFLLATKTDDSMTYQKRYATNFKNILYPMFDEFISAMKRSENVYTHVIKSKTDVPFYSEEEIVANDFWDIIDVKIEINFIENCKNNKLCL